MTNETIINSNDSLNDRKIVNYLRKNASNNENQNQIRNKILGLFYKTIEEGIPINLKVSDEESKEKLNKFPNYFWDKSREEILDLFNTKVCPRKPITYPFDLIDYDIKENTYLEISPKTMRPIYHSDWKEKAEFINKINVKYQQSFYSLYLKYYLQRRKFPNFKNFLLFIYDKYQKPVHKDIKIVFDNIQKSYEPIKDYIKKNGLSYNETKEILLKSVPITKRIEMQESIH